MKTLQIKKGSAPWLEGFIYKVLHLSAAIGVILLHFIDSVLNSIIIRKLANSHPFLLCLLAIVSLPFCLVLAVFITAFAIVLPLSFVMGWL